MRYEVVSHLRSAGVERILNLYYCRAAQMDNQVSGDAYLGFEQVLFFQLVCDIVLCVFFFWLCIIDFRCFLFLF